MPIPYSFLLFDAARAEANLVKAQELNELNRSLYKGSAEEELSGIAPYVFTAKTGSEFANWYLAEGWNNSWGLLVNVTASFEDIYKHFRRFLMVKTEDGQQLYFRFYDPRVLRVFLPTCDKEQLRDFFGPVKAFIVEDEEPDFVLQFWLENYELKSKRMSFTEAFGDVAVVANQQQEEAAEVTAVETAPVRQSPEREITPVREEPKKEEPITETQPVKKKRTFF